MSKSGKYLAGESLSGSAESQNDQQLFSRLQNGDQDALAHLIDLHSYTMLRLATGITGNADVAQDIVQDVFITLWLKARDLNIKGDLRGYLWSSIRNRARMFLRHEGVIQRHHETTLPDLASFAPFIDTVEQQEVISIIHGALTGLPPRCQEIFLLHWRDDLSYQEIATALEISVATARNQVARAVRHIVATLREK